MRPALDGAPVACAQEMGTKICLARARTGILSLPPEHPPVSTIEVTCDAEQCDEDKGAGQVIISFADGSREVVDIGFGRTN